ncbi:MAG: L-rhamnose/proton symporter RhaT [Terriglobia bacterium]
MTLNVYLATGIVLLGGVLQGVFAFPMKRMPRWQWENTWLVYSIAAMLVFPWIIVLAGVPHFEHVLREAHGATIAEVLLFGFMWGVGSTLFGLGLTRVGMALTFAIVLGITASLGSLLPLAVFHPNELFTPQGYLLLLGLVIVIIGILFTAVAGQRRERELSSQTANRSGAVFWIGLLICIISGIFSAMLNLSFVFGNELQRAAQSAGASPAMASNVIWALALSAGFVANGGYCVYLLQKNHTWGLLSRANVTALYWLGAAVMGALWFSGITFYGMGASALGALGAVVGWPLFMAMNIIASNILGTATGEWKGASRLTYTYSWTGISVLLVAIYVISRASKF